MNTLEIYHTAAKALNALQNAKPRDQSLDSIKYHTEAVEDVKKLMYAAERGLMPIVSQDNFKRSCEL